MINQWNISYFDPWISLVEYLRNSWWHKHYNHTVLRVIRNLQSPEKWNHETECEIGVSKCKVRLFRKSKETWRRCLSSNVLTVERRLQLVMVSDWSVGMDYREEKLWLYSYFFLPWCDWKHLSLTKMKNTKLLKEF